MSGRSKALKARAVGINHVALEVGHIQDALDFYGGFIEFEISKQSETAAFIYFGDQFINFSLGRKQGPDNARHIGIAVDDKQLARRALEDMGVVFLEGFIRGWSRKRNVEVRYGGGGERTRRQ